MIRRAIALLLLLAAGFVLLQLAVDEPVFGSPEAARRAKSLKGAESAPSSREAGAASQPAAPQGAVAISGKSGADKPVKAGIGGYLDFRQRREVPLANGSVMLLTLYRVTAEQSTPIAEERYRLERVRIHFYEIDERAATPTETLAGELVAATMFVTLGRDGQGATSLREDKEMELFDAVLKTNEHARAKDVELQMAHAFVLAAADGTRLRTPTDEETFSIRRKGDPEITMSGRGVTAYLPAARSRQAAAGKRLLEIRTASEPELKASGARGDSKLTAKGPLHYVEDVDLGSAHVVVDRDVTLTDTPTGATARGAHLEGWFARGTTPGKKGSTAPEETRTSLWRRIELVGAPSRVLTGDVEVECAHLTLLPGLLGDAALVHARGGTPRIVQRDREGKLTTVTARDGIHLIPVRGAQAANASVLGFPRSAFGSRFDQVVWFEGPTELVQGDLHANASLGLTLLRAVAGDARTSLRGKGEVEIRRGELRVLGDEGFAIASDGVASTLTMGSAAERLTASLPRNTLSQLRSLEVAIRGNELRAFTARGRACSIVAETADGAVRGLATRIVASEPDAVVLHGAPAHVERASGETIDAPEIRIARGSARTTLLEAFGGAKILGAMGGKGDAFGGHPIALQGETVRFVPFLAPREVRDLLYGRLGAGTRFVAERSLRSPWLFAEKAVRLDQTSAVAGGKSNEAHASGDHLALGIDLGSGQLTGMPARVVAVDERGQQNRGEAPCLRITQSSRGQIVRLLPFGRSLPRLLVGGQAGPGTVQGKGGRLEVICNGDITIAPERITFGGSGRVRSLLPSDEPDPNGLALTANALAIDRDLKTGEAKKLIARGDVVIISSQVLARADEATLAPENAPDPGWCILRDTRGGAHEVTITMASGMRLAGPLIRFNWITGAYDVWRAGIGGDAR